MKPKEIAYIAILTCVALIIFAVESLLPPPVPVPGIKPGLANIITLIALVRLGRRDAFAVTTLRIVLGTLFAGTPAALLYSLSGGLLSFVTAAVLLKILKKERLWVVSVFAAIAHNAAQICVAAFLVETVQLFWYLPVLTMSAIVTGAFTGLCASFVLKYIK